MRFIFLTCWLFPVVLGAQSPKKNRTTAPKPLALLHYDLLENGDTINKTDIKNRKQGIWIIYHEERMGEPALIEYGSFREDKKQGSWRQFTRTGQLLASENYKKGLLDGEAKYYEDGKLLCIATYYALKEKNGIDTIMVEDPLTNIEKPVTVKSETGSIRHGLWTYYDPENGKIAKVVEYQGDQIIYEKEYLSAKDTIAIKRKWKSLPGGAMDERDRVWYYDKNKRPVTFKEMHEQAVKLKRL